MLQHDIRNIIRWIFSTRMIFNHNTLYIYASFKLNDRLKYNNEKIRICRVPSLRFILASSQPRPVSGYQMVIILVSVCLSFRKTGFCRSLKVIACILQGIPAFLRWAIVWEVGITSLFLLNPLHTCVYMYMITLSRNYINVVLLKGYKVVPICWTTRSKKQTIYIYKL